MWWGDEYTDVFMLQMSRIEGSDTREVAEPAEIVKQQVAMQVKWTGLPSKKLRETLWDKQWT